MRRFIVTTEGQNRLGLRELCQQFANEQWVAAHMTPEQAAESVLDTLKRAVRAELELLEVRCEDDPTETSPQKSYWAGPVRRFRSQTNCKAPQYAVPNFAANQEANRTVLPDINRRALHCHAESDVWRKHGGLASITLAAKCQKKIFRSFGQISLAVAIVVAVAGAKMNSPAESAGCPRQVSNAGQVLLVEFCLLGGRGSQCFRYLLKLIELVTQLFLAMAVGLFCHGRFS